MKIALSGSLKFADELVVLQSNLEKHGHDVLAPVKVANVDYWADDPTARIAAKQSHDLIREHFRKIEQCDALLVANYEKQGNKDYVGANTFLEIGIAHYLGKPIALLYNLPNQSYIQEELITMKVKCLNGNITQLKEVIDA